MSSREDGTGPVTSAFGHVPELDGLRAVAIFGVVVAHTSFIFPGILFRGLMGVDLFFVLSGFLITTLLVREFEGSGSVRFRAFFARRALRLLPALALGLLLGAIVVALIGSNNGGILYGHAALYVLGYVANWFLGRHLGVLDPLWSLSLEEQYYLIWPVVLFVLLRRGVRPRRLGWVLVALAACVALARYAVFEAGHVYVAFASTFTRGDGVMLGSALGLFMASGGSQCVRRVVKQPVLFWLAVAGALYLSCLSPTPTIYRGMLFAADICFAIIVGHVVARTSESNRNLLRTGFMTSIGRISYGMYLFHYPLIAAATFYAGHGSRAGALAPHVVGALSIFVAVPSLAAISFVCVERHALALKGRVARNIPKAPLTS